MCSCRSVSGDLEWQTRKTIGGWNSKSQVKLCEILIGCYHTPDDAEKILGLAVCNKSRRRAAGFRAILPRARSNLLFWKLQIGTQRVGEAVGQIGQADQQIEVNDLGVRKVELQALNVSVGNRVGIAGELLGEVQCGFFLLAEVAVLACLQVLPVVSRESHALRRREMVLQAIAAAVDRRDADVHHLI